MKIKNFIQKARRKVGYMSILSFFSFSNILAKAKTKEKGSISDSVLATGTENLIDDATTWLLVLAPILTIVCIIYFCIRRSAADEMDIKKWNNRIVVAIVSCVGAVIASAIINIIIGYYK